MRLRVIFTGFLLSLCLFPFQVLSEEEESSISFDEEETTEIFYYNRDTDQYERTTPPEYHYRLNGLKIDVGYDEELYPPEELWPENVKRDLYAPPL